VITNAVGKFVMHAIHDNFYYSQYKRWLAFELLMFSTFADLSRMSYDVGYREAYQSGSSDTRRRWWC